MLGNVSNKRGNPSKIIRSRIEYPFNQYNKEFIMKARKGESDVNWHSLIDEIQNDIEEEFMDNN